MMLFEQSNFVRNFRPFCFIICSLVTEATLFSYASIASAIGCVRYVGSPLMFTGRLLPAAVFLVTRATFYNIEMGLANVLGIEVMKHGTSLPSYVGIRIFGGKPSGGIDASGVLDHSDKERKNYFYLFKDINSVFYKHYKEFPLWAYFFITPSLPNLHSTIAWTALFDKMFSPILELNFNFTMNQTLLICSTVAAQFCSLFTPKLRAYATDVYEQDNIIANENDANKVTGGIVMENDNQYNGLAYKTPKTFSPYRMGTLGLLRCTLNSGVLERIYNKPLKFMIGVCQLALATSIIYSSIQILSGTAIGSYINGITISNITTVMPSAEVVCTFLIPAALGITAS